ncbi:MAG: C-GCAxxG-C-C family (seleno)protein, partial [Longimicrobiales bacterium]
TAPGVASRLEWSPGPGGPGLLRPVEEGRGRRDQEVPRLGFSQPFTEEEASVVAASPMAGIIAGLNGQGYPCSEMMLLAALRRFDLPEEHLDSAAVFGGGVGKRDLCGFLTGGLMAIGIGAGAKYADRSRLHTVGRRAANTYWDWWLTRGDLHCMGPLTTHETPEEFVRMAQRSAVKLEEVMGVLMDGGYEGAGTPV